MKLPRSYSIFVFFLFMLLHQTDKLMIGSMQTPISATFGLSDLHWGLINSGSLVVATLLYPVWGYLCDRYERAKLLAVASFIWGSTAWFGSTVKTYPQFLITRASTWINDSSYPGLYGLAAFFMPFSSPNVVATVFDVTSPEVRSTAQSVEYFIENSSAALSPTLAGAIALATDKQTAILTVCITAWLLCFLFYLGALFFISPEAQALRDAMCAGRTSGEE